MHSKALQTVYDSNSFRLVMHYFWFSFTYQMPYKIQTRSFSHGTMWKI